MDKNQKFELRRETERTILYLRLKQGVNTVFSELLNLTIMMGYLLGVVLILVSTRTFGFEIVGIDLPNEIYSPIWAVIFFSYLGICLFLFFLVAGTPLGGKRIANNLRRSGPVNQAGEPPILLAKRKSEDNPRVTVMEFAANAIPLSAFLDKIGDIEAALDVHVMKITEGSSKRRILLYVVLAKYHLPKTLYWRNEYLSMKNFVLVLGENLLGKVTVNLARIPHILLGGSTGSGKTKLLQLLLLQCILKGARVILADFKGGADFGKIWRKRCEFVCDEDTLIIVLRKIVNELDRRKIVLSRCECADIDEYNQRYKAKMQRIIFACDEVGALLSKTGASKEQKEKIALIEGYLTTIACLGRSFGITLILATQRPDMDTLPGKVKSVIDCRVCGRASNVLSMIILDNTSANEQIPKDSQGLFIMHDGTLFQAYLFDEEYAFDSTSDNQL